MSNPVFYVDDEGNLLLHGLLVPKPTGADVGKVLALKGDGSAYEYVSPAEQGDPGPQGPQGIPGEDGEDGADGLSSNIIATFIADDDTTLDVTDIDALVGGTYDKKIKLDLVPSEETAALVVFASANGTNFDTTGPYSYTSAAFDNDNAMGTTLETRGPKIYGSNGDNRAHVTPNYSSNLIGNHGICGDIYIRNPQDSNKITRIWGIGSYNEPDEDTNLFLFASAREAAQVLKSLRFAFRRRSDQALIPFSGKITLYRDE